jgi:hypothetical protein
LTLRDIETNAWDSYETNYVTDVHFNDGTWSGVVDDHDVEICLDEDENVEYVSCSCNCDTGDQYCEHILALSYEIIERIDDGLVVDESDDLEIEKAVSVISELSRSELLDIAVEYAMSSNEVARKLFFKYMKPDNPMTYAKEISETVLREIKISRKVSQVQASDTQSGLAAIRRLGDEALENKDARTALELHFLCLKNLGIAYSFTYRDYAIEKEIALSIGRLSVFLEASKADRSLEELLLSSLKDMLALFSNDSKNLEKLLEIGIELNRNPENWEAIDEMLDSAKIPNKMLAYQNAKLRGKGDEYLEKHYQEELLYRSALVDKCLEKGDFARAESLCRDIAQKDFVDKWIFSLNKLGDVNAIKKYCEERLRVKEFAYYDELKALCSEEEWKGLIESVLANTSDIDFKIGVFQRENRKQELLDVCRQEPKRIVELCKDLVPEFKAEALDIYSSYIIKETVGSRTSSAYAFIRELIDKFAAEGGNRDLLVLLLMAKYPKRIKMHEILNPKK